MDRRYQVFVSSTFADLKDERREVIQALLELDCIPAGMELFPAANEDQWELIEKVIDDCDYYIVIVGGRYGSITEAGVSFTEREYDYAKKVLKPILGFLHSDPDSIPSGKTDQDNEAQERLRAFRKKVMSKPVRKWTTPDQLGSVVSRSLVQLIRKEPAEGWVRGRFALTPELQKELSDLRAHVAELELQKVKAEHGTPWESEQYAQGEEETKVCYDIASYSFGMPNSAVYTGAEQYTWDELISLLGPLMMNESTERQLIQRIGSDILKRLEERDAVPSGLKSPSISVARSDFENILVQFRVLNYIEHGSKKRPVSDRNVYWRLTDKGDKQLIALRALKKGGKRVLVDTEPSDDSGRGDDGGNAE